MDKAIGYVKVYTSPDSADLLPGQIKQKNEINKYCNTNKLFLERIIVEKVLDEKSETPLLNNLIFKRNDDETLGKVVVFKSSVLSSDSRFYLYCCFSLARREIELVSVKDDYIKDQKISPKDRSLVYAMAFFEKKRMGYLLQEGRTQKRISGEYIPGTSPYGYKKINGKYGIDTSEAEVVKLIFKMREGQNKRIAFIVNFLNKNGIKTRRGKEWRNISVSNVIKNKKVYHGYIYSPTLKAYKKGDHDPIL